MFKIFRYGFILLWSLSTLAMAAEPVEVIVEGLEGDTLKNVQAGLALPPSLVQEGRVDPLWLKLFERQIPEKVRQALEPFGYYNPQIRVSLEVIQEGLFRLRVYVEPGHPVRVSSAKIELRGMGSQEQELKDLVKAFSLKEGDILRQTKYEEAKGALKAKALELGYLDADFSVHEIRVSQGERKASIELVLETGSQYYFGEVTFAGTPNYPERFLRRYLAFRAGEVFSYSKIAQTQLNLINSDRFKEAGIDARKEESQNLRIPVKINLAPSKPKRFRFGVGYETDLGPRLSARYQDLNFQRRGHELDSELNLSQRLQGLVTSYVWPGQKDLDSKTSFKLGIQREDTETYTSRSVFLGPEYVHSFAHGSGLLHSLGRGSIGSVYLQARLEDFRVGEEDGRSRLLMPGLRFSRRQYDDLIRPTRGYRFALETRGAAQAFGSDTNFLQLLFNGDMLIPLPLRFALFLRAQAGVTWSDPVEDLPPSVRFFAGGDQSVRGYAYQSLGPKDIFGNVTGGKHLLAGSIELEKPISKLFGIAAFYDVGNAFNSLNNVDLQQGAGMGIRLYTPVGPVRFDLARQVGVKDPKFRVHFTVGFQL
ncbi:MAG TPA: autotransporter assembly complex family protein [Thermodesulfobacteriota bacterium]|nr:autotransporter assembly complex family protein [Thermodesulfobacteriota bacterium]